MASRFPFFLVCALLAVAAAPSVAAEFRLPPIEGELTGKVSPLKGPATPALDWKIVLAAPTAAIRAVEVLLSGPGATVRTAVQVDDAMNGNWRLLEGSIDLATWYPALVATSEVDTSGIIATGLVTMEGEGALEGGKMLGRVRVKLRDGGLNDSTHGLDLKGLALEIEFTDLIAPRTAPAQVLTWQSGKYDAFELGAGRIVFSVVGDRVQVDEARLAIWGGEVVLEAFAFVIGKPEISVQARLVAIDVAHLTPLLPSVLAEARGRVDGSLALRRDANGVAISAGHLALRSGESADLRLAPKPGLISGSLPSAVLKYYPGLGKIETGEVPLRADVLEIRFTPGGDAEGRSATIHVAGGPVDPNLRAPIDLTINVRGPLESLIKFGTNSRLRFGGTP